MVITGADDLYLYDVKTARGYLYPEEQKKLQDPDTASVKYKFNKEDISAYDCDANDNFCLLPLTPTTYQNGHMIDT